MTDTWTLSEPLLAKPAVDRRRNGALPIRPPRQQPIHIRDAGDANGDGHLDVVVGNEGAANQLLIDDGNGGFGSGPPRRQPRHKRSPWERNGDGHLDVVVGTHER